MKSILVAPNSFKECAGSTEIAHMFSEFLDHSKFRIDLLPLSDGGDGFLEVCKVKFNLSSVNYSVQAPYNDQLINVEAGYSEETQTVYIESANAIGLKVIPANRRRPSELNSFGLGQILRHLVEDHKNNLLRINKLVIGIGGTGTMDLGLGACKAFGLKLVDFYHKEIDVIPENFMKSGELILPDQTLPFEVDVIQDVSVPISGKGGSARIFGHQKGANDPEIQVLEIGYKNIFNLLKKKNIDADIESTGAGGGLAFGLSLLGKMNLRTAGEFILDDLNLVEFIESAPEFVITGEGSFDFQSGLGKASGFILDKFPSSRKFLVCGSATGAAVDDSGNTTVIELSKFFSGKDESILGIREGIRKACDVINKSVL